MAKLAEQAERYDEMARAGGAGNWVLRARAGAPAGRAVPGARAAPV